MISVIIRKPVLFLTSLLILSASAATPPESLDHTDPSIERVFEAFRSPAVHAKPFVRWWWNNNQVEEGEIVRQLDVLSAAGIGGVEINPIEAKKPATESQAKVLKWRSPEWDRALLVACRAAKERGMIVDLIAGSGWPFGGEFLKPEDQIMRLVVQERVVQGGGRLRLPVNELIAQKATGIEFLRLYPREITSLKEIRDLTPEVAGKEFVDIELPEGEHILSCGSVERSFCEVVFGVPGASGVSMDHMQKAVTRAYLNRLLGVEEKWGEPLAKHVRAIFCDSIETMGANWTHGMTDQFRKRKGYDITPWLPLILGGQKHKADTAMADQILRARYDWSEHVVAVFLENFTAEYSAFCHEHGLLSRYQAYGIPHLMGMAEGYMIPDIPESNNWLYSQDVIDPMNPPHFTWNQKHGYMLWNKYASAAGRMRGKKIISSEAMTNTKKVFHTTLATIKQADDMNFITGITHSVLHGYNYVPPDVPFPGWIRFGTFFSEHNTWWPYFPLWANYNARLSSVFQETRAVAEVAILGRTADHWAATGLERDPIHLEPLYLHRLWEPFSQMGIATDYLHETALQTATIEKGLLKAGAMSYELLIVAEADSILPATADAIKQFAQGGGKVVFVNREPGRAPGLADAEQENAKVKEAIRAALDAGATTVPGPADPADSGKLREWVASILERSSWKPGLRIRMPCDGLYSLRHRAPDAEIVFLANTHRTDSVRSRIDFPLGQAGLWRWNPESGEREPYRLAHDGNGFEIDLHPLESLLLVTGPKQDPQAAAGKPSDPFGHFTITTPWNVNFKPVNSKETFDITMDTLADFTSLKDPRIRNFSGTAVYRSEFDLDHTDFTQLRLGLDNDFISEVELNGKSLGVIWYGIKPLDLKGSLKKGRNKLTIRYTTTLWNAMKREDHQPSGILGPVSLH